MKRKKLAIVLNPRDNVATSLEALGAGDSVIVDLHGKEERITLVSTIPAGHKFALVDVESGGAVIKYGAPIGQSRQRIGRGEHVHTHNLESGPGKGGQGR